jgi:hypothetical protein
MDVPHATTVKGALAWALAGAVRFAVATAVVALVLSTFVQGTDAERFASTAYLALTFAAILLIAKWFVPAARDERPASLRIPTLPVLLASLLGLGAILAAGAGLVADPSAEVRALAYCLAAVGVAAVGRAGVFTRLRATLARGDRLEATIRYATLFSVVALLFAAQLPQQIGDVIAAFAYGGGLVAAVALAFALVAPTPLGSHIRNACGEGLRTIEGLSSDLVFARMIDVSVVTMVASIAVASLFRPPYSEPFAMVAYASALFAALGVGMESRRRPAAKLPAAAHPIDVARSLAIIAARADRFAKAWTAERVIRGSVATAVAAFLIASLLLRRSAEPFAVVGFVATIVTAAGVAAECWRSIPSAQLPP